MIRWHGAHESLGSSKHQSRRDAGLGEAWEVFESGEHGERFAFQVHGWVWAR